MDTISTPVSKGRRYISNNYSHYTEAKTLIKSLDKSNAFRFFVFGGVTSVFCIVVGYILFHFFPDLGFSLINVLAGTIGILLNFHLNHHYNFGGKASANSIYSEFLKFSTVALTAIGLLIVISAGFEQVVHNLAQGWQGLETSGLIRSIGHGFILMLVAVVSYLGHALFSFGKRLRG
jgi:putative flippase GtrA